MAQVVRNTLAVLLAADLQPGQLGIAYDAFGVRTGDMVFGTGDSSADNTIISAGAGATALAALTDTNLSPGAPEDQYVLTWDNSTSLWIAQANAGGGGVSTFDALTDTPAYTGAGGQLLRVNGAETGVEYFAQSLTTADISDISTGTVAGDVFQWDGSAWSVLALGTAGQILAVNAGATALEYVANAGGGASVIDDLTDVDTTTVAPTVGQVLEWDGTSQWLPATVAGAFIDLTDTPVALGTASQFMQMNAGATLLEFTTPSISALSDVDTTGTTQNHIMIEGGASVYGTVLHTIENVSNVDAAALADNVGLVYNLATTNWEMSEALSVDTTGVLEGCILFYDATTSTWIATTVAPTDGQVMAWNITTETWDPTTPAAGADLYAADGTLAGARVLEGNSLALAFDNVQRWSASNGGAFGLGVAHVYMDGTGVKAYGSARSALHASDSLLSSRGNSVTDTVFSVKSITQGSVPAPVMTDVERDAIATPSAGMQVFTDGTTEQGLQYHDGLNWQFAGGAYRRTFVIADWTANAITIAATVHLRGTEPTVIRVYQDTGTELEEVIVDTVSVNKTTGDVTITHAATDFDGRIYISA